MNENIRWNIGSGIVPIREISGFPTSKSICISSNCWIKFLNYMEEGKIMTGIESVEFAVKLARFLRKLPTFGGQKIVGNVRRRASHTFFRLLHQDVYHRLRFLGICMETGQPDKLLASQAAIDFCTACAFLFQQVLEIERHEIHCCLKVIVKNQDGKPVLKTWARSQPHDERDDNEVGSVLDENTSWCAFAGKTDGKNVWPRMCCFCCNDLTQYTHEFDNGRKDWQKYYKAKLTFPLKYIERDTMNTLEIIGFLEFDSVKQKAFSDMPCSFGFQKTPNEFRKNLEKSTVFHAGAIIADALSMSLRPYYESRRRQR